MFGRLTALSFVAALLLTTTPAQSAIVKVTAQRQDVLDNTPGADLWSSHYVVTLDNRVGEFSSISLLFDPTHYGDIALRMTPNPDIEVLTLQPDANSRADGMVQLTTLVALLRGATFSFDVDYVRLRDLPGKQGYVVRGSEGEFMDAGYVAEVDASSVPEPGAAALALAATAALALQRRRGRRSV